MMASQPSAPPRDKTKGLFDSILNKAATAAHAKLSAHLDKPTQSPEYQHPQSHQYYPSSVPPQPASHPPPYTPHNVPYQPSHDSFPPSNQQQPQHLSYHQPPFISNDTTFNSTQPPQISLSITTGIICPGCEVGLTPGDTCFQCQTCPENRNIFCETCHHHGRSCAHSPQQRHLILVAKDIKKKQYPKDELGFDYKCIGCKIRIKHLDFCWHCKECFSYPDTCQDCWKVKDQRCRHAGRKKIELRKVPGSGNGGSGADGALDVLETVFG